MSRVMRTTAAVGLAFAALSGITAAQAGDLAPPVYGPGPYPVPPPNYGPGYGGPCHIVLDRRIDPYGREIVHRVRVCDEGAMYAPGPVAPGYGYPAPHYVEPQPSGYYPYPPRPPAPVGPGYYHDY